MASDVPERMARVISNGQRSRSSEVSIAAVTVDLALVAALLFGAWWTAQAVQSGSVGAVAVRFTLALLIGVYYLGLRSYVRR